MKFVYFTKSISNVKVSFLCTNIIGYEESTVETDESKEKPCTTIYLKDSKWDWIKVNENFSEVHDRIN